MALVPTLQGKTVAVMGLGKSGTSAARALMETGATVWAWDDKPETRAAGEKAGLSLVDLAGADLSQLALIVWSPGIPHTLPRVHPVAERARRAGIPLVCDVDLLIAANSAAQIVGITGTNGKSTTTTLTGHIFEASGRTVAVGGNLGTPALDLPAWGEGGAYVLELSSYQLELMDRSSFDVAVLLNITPDHLARHGSMDGYAAVKASLFGRLRPGGAAVIGIDDAASLEIFQRVKTANSARALPISVTRPAPGGVWAVDGRLIDDIEGRAEQVIDLTTLPRLPGRHNWQNACAAYAAARAAGINRSAICGALATYPGLAHRQELVAVIDGIAYVNDSKATNADAVEKAMVCYDAIYWILGGQPKEGGIASLEPLFPRVRKAFLIGDATEQFAATLEGKVTFERCGTLDRAVAEARAAALAGRATGQVVLLSPACASWDQFASFEQRGDAFRGLVAALPGVRGAA